MIYSIPWDTIIPMNYFLIEKFDSYYAESFSFKSIFLIIMLEVFQNMSVL